VKNQWDLFAPRVALAWDPKGDGKMVIRSSFGISYDYVNGSMYVNSADSPPFGNTTVLTGGQFDNPFAGRAGTNIFPYSLNSNSPFVTGGTYIAETPNMKATEVYQWNFVIQRQFGKDWVASATYTGSESEHLLSSYDSNPTVNTGNCGPGKAVATCPRLFTLNGDANAQFYNAVEILDSNGTSSYNGMILAIQKRLSKGLSTSANYTWSHCIGDLTIGNSTGNSGAGLQILSTGSGVAVPSNRAYDRGNCQSAEIGGTFSSDRRQIFNWTTVYETPKFGNRGANMIASGWKIAGIYRAMSAPWVTVGLATDNSLTGVTGPAANLRPNATGQPSLCPNPGPTCWINPAAFVTPTLGTFGNSGRSNVQAPAFWQLDMSLSREFRIREGSTLQVRADAFNITNSMRAGIAPPSLAAGASGLNLTLGTAGFGTITSSLDPRIMQLAMKFVF
jgi:hypothetical protein